MTKRHIISLISFLLVSFPCAILAQDTTFTRVVTVERDFQPNIQSAGKINQTPSILQHELQLNPVVYSTYSLPLSVDYNIHPLKAAETRFTHQAPLNGIVQGAVGHRNTQFLFGYRMLHKKKTSLDLYANHNAYWGRDALSDTRLGMLLTGHLKGADIYFGVEGNNEYFSYYGRYFDGQDGLTLHTLSEIKKLDGTEPIRLNENDWQSLWRANAKIGVRSTSKTPFQYHLQTGYQAFILPNYTTEHQIRSLLSLGWLSDKHSAGINMSAQNNMYAPLASSGDTPSARHSIHMEPYYAFKSKKIRLHIGLNMDLNIGSGQMMSKVENLAFAPSPNVKFEWNMMDNLFQVYAKAKGYLGNGSVEEFLGYNRYLNILHGLQFAHPREYTPVDAQIGFKLRPTNTLLLDVYGGYTYVKNGCNMQAQLNVDNPGVAYYKLWVEDYQRWKVGTTMHYHYRDILEINLGANYYFYQQGTNSSKQLINISEQNETASMIVFDRPNWDIQARIDLHFDSKWSIYSENYFAGSRIACISQGSTLSTKELKPTISLNIGGQYAVNRWLITYLQLNNYLNRKNDIFYGYQSQGCHFLLGIKWKF